MTDNAPSVPEYLKQYMVPATSQAATDVESLASSSMSIPRLSLKAKKFRFIEAGEEVKSEPITHVVILAVEPGPGKFVKTFYEGAYNPGDTTPPSCASSDGIRPDSWVTTPQNDLCSTCANNRFGSATSRSGGKAKACRDSKRLWVVPPDDIEGTVYGMQVPVTSLKNLSELGTKIKATGLPISAAVVKMSMEEDESFPIVNFELAGWLGEKFIGTALERNTKKNWQGALLQDNPPVQGSLEHKVGTATPQVAVPAQTKVQPPQQPKIAQDGAIEGSATVVQDKPKPNADDALKIWG